MMDVRYLRCAGLSCLLAIGLSGIAQAQPEARDPTLPPPMATAAPDAPARSSLGFEGMSVIVRDGKPGLVVGTRVVLPGQKLGAWTLESITETEIFLRDGKQLRTVPRFSGIERRDPAPVTACAAPVAPVAPVASAKKPPAPTQVDTPCDVPPTRSANP